MSASRRPQVSSARRMGPKARAMLSTGRRPTAARPVESGRPRRSVPRSAAHAGDAPAGRIAPHDELADQGLGTGRVGHDTRDATREQDGDPVAQVDELVEIGGYDDSGHSLGGERPDALPDRGYGPHVQAVGGLVEHHDSWLERQLAASRPSGCCRRSACRCWFPATGCPDVELADEPVRGGMDGGRSMAPRRQ